MFSTYHSESDGETPHDVGRPRIPISIEEVEFLRSLHLKWNQIADILEVSRHTLYRRIKEEGILLDLKFSDITDGDLDEVIKAIKLEHPNDGEVMVKGHLVAKGVRVPRAQLRASIHRIDLFNTAERRSTAVVRRIYSVGVPNELWHFDGHHKLIRWRLVIHGCVDGFSRTITYLHCSTNNSASTVLHLFTKAVEQYGLPQKVRSDLGGENVDVWRFLIAQHNNEEVVITGSSTHNERIERLWRDVFRCVGKLFYDTFYALEEEQVLDPMNEIDMYCLHYVFVPLINNCLRGFVESWNNHQLSSEHNYTPYQLFFIGNLGRGNTDGGTTHDFTNIQLPSYFRVSEAVTVPRSTFCPCYDLKMLLQHSMNPCTISLNFGASTYRRCVSIVGNHILACSSCTC